MHEIIIFEINCGISLLQVKTVLQPSTSKVLRVVNNDTIWQKGTFGAFGDRLVIIHHCNALNMELGPSPKTS